MRPPFIGNYTDFLESDDFHYPGSPELHSIGAAVGKKLGLKKIGVHVEHLPPGRRTSWPHAESEEEEFVFVIEGTPQVWINGTLHDLRPGDFAAFPAGTGIAHTFINNGSAMVRLLVGGEASRPTNKITYPLHPDYEGQMAERLRWTDPPAQVLGGHDGLPDAQRVRLPQRWGMPVFETQRLRLRPFELTDAEDLFAYASDPLVAENVSWDPHASVEESRKVIRVFQQNYISALPNPLAVELKASPGVIGAVGVFWNTEPMKILELGYVIRKDYWGNGIVPEACLPLIDHCWQNFDVARIQARCKTHNLASKRVMEKLGMRYDGMLPQSYFSKGKSWDMEMFSLCRP